MYSRYFQPHGLRRRLPLADASLLKPEHHLRYVEVVEALRHASGPELGLLLAEKADIDCRAGRFAVALAGLDLAETLAPDPATHRRLAYQRGRTEYLAGELDGAEAAYTRVVAGDDGLAAQASLQLGRVHLAQGRFAVGIAALRKGLQNPTLQPADRLAGLYDLVYACAHEGDLQQAETLLTEADRSLDQNDALGRARLAYYRAWIATSQRDLDTAVLLIDEARREFHLQHDLESTACADLTRACLDLERADLTACLERCDRVPVHALHRPDTAVSVLLLRGLALFLMGRFADAQADYRRAERLAASHRRDGLVARAQEWRAEVHGFCEQWDEAESTLRACLELRRSIGDRLGEVMALQRLAGVARQRGQVAVALERLAQGRALAEALGDRLQLAHLDAEEMETRFQHGDTAEAKRKAEAALEAYRELGDKLRQVRMWKHLAQIAAVRDDFAEAERCFEVALQLLGQDANRMVRAEILDSRAEARADCSRVADALQDLHTAESLVATTGSVHLANALSCHATQVRERHAAQALLSRYMEPKIVSRLLARGPRRLAENVQQEATILFSDVRGFTNLTERLGAHEVVGLLNEHFEAMTEVIVAHGGTIDKFIGDAVMAVFGDPGRPRGDDAARGVQAAVAMFQRRQALNTEAKRHGRVWIEIGVGVATGEVVMGNIGSARRMTYTVIGDAVNVASRLEGLTKDLGHPVLISGATRRLAGEAVSARPLGDFEVKGKARLVEAWAVGVEAT